MARFVSRLLVAETTVAFAFMLVLGSHDAAAQTRPGPATPVTIVNTDPVPVSGIVTVDPTQPVEVTGSVTVSNPSTTATVDNPASNPVLVRNVDASLREPVQVRGVPTSFSGSTGTVTLVTVPAGKMLIVEHVSLWANLAGANGLLACTLSTSNLGAPQDYLLCQPMGSNALNHIFVANASTKFMAGPGETVRLSADTFGGGGGFVAGFISGYYVPVP